jgi:hypothetical protein
MKDAEAADIMGWLTSFVLTAVVYRFASAYCIE